MAKSLFRRKTWSPAKAAFFLFVVTVLVAVDQLVKWEVVRHIKNQDIPVLGDFLHFTYEENTGAAFSLMTGKVWLLSLVALIMVVVCLYILLRQKLHAPLGNLALLLISSGGMGNLIDRLFRGHVVDFLYVKKINFAVFNVADSYVVVGAILLCIFLLREERSGGREVRRL